MESTPPTGNPADESPPVPEQSVAVEEEIVETAPALPRELSGPHVTIGVPREVVPGERRVALVPDIVKRLVQQGHKVIVESNAGEAAHLLDSAYETAGATIVPDHASVFQQADLIVKVQKPTPKEVALLRRGQALIAFLQPMVNTDLVQALRDKGVVAFSMDAIPRTSRAQYMDALSSMATVSGYKAVLLAADHLAKFMPLLTTAAGNIPPAKVLVIGAGVAGLQAIATARRLGAVVEAYRHPTGRQGTGPEPRRQICRNQHRFRRYPNRSRLRARIDGRGAGRPAG